MPKEHKRNVAKDTTRAVRKLLAARPDDDLDVRDIMRAIRKGGVIDQETLNGWRDKAIQTHLSNLLTKATFTTPEGETVRAFQSYTKFEQTDDGREVQREIWKDIDSTTEAQMVASLRQRAQHARAVLAQGVIDGNYWNAHVAPRIGARQIKLDFLKS